MALFLLFEGNMRLFQKKRILRDIIPEGYIDIHSHLLPGIDDGSKNIESTIQYLRQLKEIGFSGVIPTPHIMNGVWDNTEESIEQTFTTTQNQLPSDIQCMLKGVGAEYMVDFDFLNKIKSQSLLTLNDRHILVEFSFMEAPQVIYDVISELKMKDYNIILAHPERYTYYHKNFILYEELKNYDVKFQMNLLSAVGYYGDNVAKIADQLLEKNYINFTGSDLHHEGHLKAFNNAVIIKNTSLLNLAMRNNAMLSSEMIGN